MSADSNPIEYWTPVAAPPPHAAGEGGGLAILTGPQRAGCVAMLGVTAVASALAFGIVTALAWVLA